MRQARELQTEGLEEFSGTLGHACPTTGGGRLLPRGHHPVAVRGAGVMYWFTNPGSAMGPADTGGHVPGAGLRPLEPDSPAVCLTGL